MRILKGNILKMLEENIFPTKFEIKWCDTSRKRKSQKLQGVNWVSSASLPT